ncbi:MAG: hypothetical protein KDB60_14615 [Propionibacteriaceae bacterium]|nr:hypothetical protein [Propionibacteriaceae bacterium]
MGDFLSSLWRAIVGVWSLDSSMAEWFRSNPQSLEISITIAMLAGISTLLGNSVVLFWNRIRGWRFGVSLVFNGVSMVALFVVQAVVIALIGYLFTGDRLTFFQAARAVMLATAPLLFGFLELAPYLGPGIARILQVWSLLALWTIVAVVYQVGYWDALLITAVGWGVMQGLSWALARPLSALGNGIWKALSGNPTLLTAQDILSGHQFMPVEFDFDVPAIEGDAE